MHRGDLAQHRIEAVLRTAAAEHLTGGIELEGDVALCIYLEGGEVYLASRVGDDVTLTVDDAMADPTYEAARQADEERLRSTTVAVLAEAMARETGWYFFHDLTEHPAQGLWGWTVGSLLADASPLVAPVADAERPEPDPSPDDGPAGAPARPAPRSGVGTVDGRPPARLGPEPVPAGAAAEADAASGPADGAATDDAERWCLSPSVPPEAFDATTWAVLVAITGTVDRPTVTARLGGPVEEAESAFGRLVARGVLVPGRPDASADPVPGLTR